MSLSVKLFRIVLFTSLFPAGAVALAGPVENLKPGEWYEAPNSHLSALDPNPARSAAYSGNSGQGSVIGAWSSAAIDTKRNLFIVWGGGHADYAGNEVYAFDLNALKWARLTDPDATPIKQAPYTGQGNPSSRHTYDYLQYVPAIDRVCTLGGAALWGDGNAGTHNIDCFNSDTRKWEKKGEMPGCGNTIASISAVDLATGHVWVHGTYVNSWLTEWDPAANAWTAHGSKNADDEIGIRFTAAIDPGRKMMVAIGGGEVLAWDLSKSGNIKSAKIATTGATEAAKPGNPGLEYDPVSGRLVSWSGGANVYTLDLDAKVWAKVPPVGSNTVTPTAACGAGTFGRFRYWPVKNVFVVVNSVKENVFIYRLTAAGTGVGLLKVPAWITPMSILQAALAKLTLADDVRGQVADALKACATQMAGRMDSVPDTSVYKAAKAAVLPLLPADQGGAAKLDENAKAAEAELATKQINGITEQWAKAGATLEDDQQVKLAAELAKLAEAINALEPGAASAVQKATKAAAESIKANVLTAAQRAQLAQPGGAAPPAKN